MWMILIVFIFLNIHDQADTRECYVDFTYSLTCNGSNTVSSELTEGSVMLQYRTSADWITTNSAIFQETSFSVNDNATHLQLRWIQPDVSESPAWFIDEIFIDCYPFSATIVFEEQDRTFDKFWECSSGHVEVGNTACVQGSTASHLLMNGTEREARTTVFDISSTTPSDSNIDAVSSCRECPSEMVSSLHWPMSYVGTQLIFPCSVNPVNITRVCVFNDSVAAWQPSIVDIFNQCMTGIPPAEAICGEEMTNSLLWPEISIGSNSSQFCLQNEMHIRRQCIYDGSSAYWYPNASTIQEQCPNGTQVVSETFGMIANQIDEVPPDEGIQLIQNFTSAGDYTYPNDLVLVTNLTASVLDRLEGSASKEFSEQFGMTVSDLLNLDAVNAVRNSSELNQADYVVSVLELTDRFALENHDPKLGDTISDNIYMTAVEIDNSSNELIEVFSNVQNSSIKLNSSIFMNLNVTGRAGGVFFSNLSDILPRDNRSNYTLESPVFSVVVNGMDSLENSPVVLFNLTHRQPREDETPICAYYDLTDSRNPFWSDSGCQLVETTNKHTLCSCYHLTHFGVLFDARGTNSKIDGDHRTALQIITYVGVAISLPLLLVTMICYLALRSLWSLHTFVNINLCATLFIAQLIFVIGIDQTSNEAGCAAVAIILHYFFLTAFMWMLMKGIILYILLVKVFAQIDWKYYTAFTLLSYGGPLLYMILCIPLGLARTDEWSYGSDHICWLTYNDNFIWAFIVPILLIIIVNLGFLAMTLKIIYKNRNTAKSKKGSLWYWFKGCFTLIISMGVTWIFGLLALHELLLPLIYLFAIFTSIQGVWIFILFVVLSRPVHEAGKQWWSSTVSKSEVLSTYYFKKTQSSSSFNVPTHISKKETSQVSVVDVKSSIDSRESFVKVETYDSSPKLGGRLSISPVDSNSIKESCA